MLNALSILLIVSLFSSCGLDCIDRKTGLHRSTHSLKEARQKDVFRFEMIPIDKLPASDSGVTIVMKNAWVENSWSYECINYTAVVQKNSRLQFIFDGSIETQDTARTYWLKEPDAGTAISLDGGGSLVFAGQDTFRLVLYSAGFLYREKTIIDTIRFVKKNTPINASGPLGTGPAEKNKN